MIRNYKLTMPILPATVHVVTGRDMLEKYAYYHGIEEYDSIRDILCRGSSISGHFLPMGSGAICMLYLPEKYEPITVAHECLHAAVFMWDNVGANLRLPDNDEVLTYTSDYIHKFIKEQCYGN